MTVQSDPGEHYLTQSSERNCADIVDGVTEARRRIAEAKHTAAEELDIGGLGLAGIPAEICELTQLRVLLVRP